MAEPPVVNSSPLIILTRAGILDFLRLLADQAFVPAAVAHEIATYGEDDITVQAIAEADWLVIVDVPAAPSALDVLGLGAGETATLAWAISHPGATAILDDEKARRAALRLGIPVVGTLGLIVAAKEHGLIVQAAPVVERARRAGLYLTERLVRASLGRIGE